MAKIGISRFVSCFAVDIYGNVQVKGGERNGYEKDRRIFKGAS